MSVTRENSLWALFGEMTNQREGFGPFGCQSDIAKRLKSDEQKYRTKHQIRPEQGKGKPSPDDPPSLGSAAFPRRD